MAEVKMESTSSLDLPPNSYKSREKAPKKEQHKIEKTKMTGNITVKKRGFMSKMKGSFISEDAGNVGEYVIKDVIIPTAKDLLFNSVRSALEMVLYGRVRKTSNRTSYSSISTGTYVYNGRSSTNSKKPSKPASAYFDVNNIMFDTRSDAENVLDDLVTLLENYPACTIGDFYDAMGQSAPYTAENYGWTNLSEAQVRSCRDGYYIDFPPYKLVTD